MPCEAKPAQLANVESAQPNAAPGFDSTPRATKNGTIDIQTRAAMNNITSDELDAILAEPATPPGPGWLQTVCATGDAGLDPFALADLATERHGSVRGTIDGLLEGLRLRCAADPIALAMLDALAEVHIPDLADEVRFG